MVSFLDGDKDNCDIDNLVLIDNKEHRLPESLRVNPPNIFRIVLVYHAIAMLCQVFQLANVFTEVMDMRIFKMADVEKIEEMLAAGLKVEVEWHSPYEKGTKTVLIYLICEYNKQKNKPLRYLSDFHELVNSSIDAISSSKKELAEKMGCVRQNVSQTLNRGTVNMRYDSFYRMVCALGYEIVLRICQVFQLANDFPYRHTQFRTFFPLLCRAATFTFAIAMPAFVNSALENLKL